MSTGYKIALTQILQTLHWRSQISVWMSTGYKLGVTALTQILHILPWTSQIAFWVSTGYKLCRTALTDILQTLHWTSQIAVRVSTVRAGNSLIGFPSESLV